MKRILCDKCGSDCADNEYHTVDFTGIVCGGPRREYCKTCYLLFRATIRPFVERKYDVAARG